MERNIGVERLYFLGDYKNIKFSNNLVGIPEELVNNDRVISLLFYQAMLSCDIAYRQYHALTDQIAKEKIEDVLAFLEKERTQTYQELYEEIKQAVEPNKKAAIELKEEDK